MRTAARAGDAPAAAWSSDPRRRSLVRVVLYTVATRLLLWAVVEYAFLARHPRIHSSALHDFGAGALATIQRWDVWWYVSVVEEHYRFEPAVASNVAFLPGFPAFIALVRPVFGSAALSAMVVANVAFVAAVVAFWGWVRDRAGVLAAERAAIWLMVYPFSFFFDTGYAESIYFLWCVLALRAADRENFAQMALFASLATLTRPMGLFLVPAFVFSLAPAYRAGRLPRAGFLAALAPLVALSLHGAYLWRWHGSPFAMWSAQWTGWELGQHWSLLNLPDRDDPYRKLADVFHVLLPLPLVYLSVRAFRKFGSAAGIYALLTTMLGVVLGGDSVGREALAVVPAFAVLGLPSVGPKALVAFRVASFALLLTFTYAFALGRFMG